MPALFPVFDFRRDLYDVPAPLGTHGKAQPPMSVMHIIGGGLAGCEAAWQAAQAGIDVVVHEMRPHRRTEAHGSDRLAELVCSSAFRAEDADYNAVGLLDEEMRRLDRLILTQADLHKVPDGGALGVDR